MKKIYIFILGMTLCLVFSSKTNSQTITPSGSVFLPQDSIEFTYNSPAFSSTDWIGIYKSDKVPGEGESIEWAYIQSVDGKSKLKAPAEAGKYKAFLCCCDGYDVIAVSEEFTVEIPELTTSFPVYVQGDSIVFSYYSPKYSSTDKIAIYREYSVPGTDEPVASEYITSEKGNFIFNTYLEPDYYDVYLLCCDGYESITTCFFQVIDSTEAFLTPKMEEFESGVSMEFTYNDPDFAEGDWIGLYLWDQGTSGTAITWSFISSKSGIVSFPGVLQGGIYVASLKNASNTEYIASDIFIVAESTSDSYIKTAAGVYPTNRMILVNYLDFDLEDKDWIGIYKKGDNPGGPESILWQYITEESATVEFNALPLGDYVVYLFCCDGYNIKAKYDFKVVNNNTPSLIMPAFSNEAGNSLEFIYNDPNFEGGKGTDWIGIYYEGDIPSDVRSLIWDYLPDGNGTMTFSTPYANGTIPEDYPNVSLPPNEYWAGLFCCDAYGVYAFTSFVVTELGTFVKPDITAEGGIIVYPNPTRGFVNIEVANMNTLQEITVYSITGQVVYQEKINGFVSKKSLDLKNLNKGIYFVEASTGKNKLSKKLIIQ